MERLCIRAGKRALEMIRDGGFRFDRVTAYAGPAVGPRWLVASGILAERTDEALVSLASHGFKPEKVLKEGEWIAVLAVREP